MCVKLASSLGKNRIDPILEAPLQASGRKDGCGERARRSNRGARREEQWEHQGSLEGISQAVQGLMLREMYLEFIILSVSL